MNENDKMKRSLVDNGEPTEVVAQNPDKQVIERVETFWSFLKSLGRATLNSQRAVRDSKTVRRFGRQLWTGKKVTDRELQREIDKKKYLARLADAESKLSPAQWDQILTRKTRQRAPVSTSDDDLPPDTTVYTLRSRKRRR